MAKSGPREKKAYHHGDLKSVLLDETARILREEGEDALSLRRLAANIGVSRTAPYHHFRDKQSLLCAVADNVQHMILARILQGAGAASASSIAFAICKDRFDGNMRQRIFLQRDVEFTFAGRVADNT